ncbi:hypothetical protein HMPREF9162_2251 [Selenomonas sp. oral taxon 137 str. F0430]|uniref:hypothetical protein n=1 Tax=Selenomonas sp. oral taxon 137 TaxID=712531 RepID=UPI0001EB1EBD|nr:hypothetical protein [Selenomonas sp. oral taxon 137]EFR40820.1 hypothetical protein HMPREF9162_2251 [Selenomonas sp. oral taxon 137 str. F0430]
MILIGAVGLILGASLYFLRYLAAGRRLFFARLGVSAFDILGIGSLILFIRNAFMHGGARRSRFSSFCSLRRSGLRLRRSSRASHCGICDADCSLRRMIPHGGGCSRVLPPILR